MAIRVRLLPVFERAGRFALHRSGFESRIVHTRAAPLHVYDAQGLGALPTTVVLHGIGSAATNFGSILSRLRRHARRVVAPDLPGHGFSAPPKDCLTPHVLFASITEALDRLVPEPMVLVGNSLGGALALRFALERPERVLALTLLSPAGARVSPAEWEELRRAFQIDSAAEARRLLRRLYHRAPWYMSAIAPDFCDVMQRRAIRDVLENATLEDLPPPEQLRQLTMPVLLWWGKSERVMPSSSLAYFRQHLPGHAVVEEPDGFGHCPHFDNPERLAARVVEFAREVTKKAS